MAEQMQNIQRRMKSIGSTERITNAMKLVSAAKLRKAKAVFESSRMYLGRLLSDIQGTMEDVEDIVTDLEELLEKKLSPTTKVGLYVHISCLIERMILRQEITTVEGFDALLGEHGDIIMKMKHVFSGVEMRYSVEVPYPEMYYILNYFKISDN